MSNFFDLLLPNQPPSTLISIKEHEGKFYIMQSYLGVDSFYLRNGSTELVSFDNFADAEKYLDEQRENIRQYKKEKEEKEKLMESIKKTKTLKSIYV